MGAAGGEGDKRERSELSKRMPVPLWTVTGEVDLRKSVRGSRRNTVRLLPLRGKWDLPAKRIAYRK